MGRKKSAIRIIVARSFLAVAMVAVLAACESTPKEEYVERPVEELYNEAMDSLTARSYEKAAKLFDEVERQHPYSVWATKAQLMAAFSLYQVNNYNRAVVALSRFIQLHPGNPDAPYAYYLKALCYYERISDVERDQKMTEQALRSLRDVVRRFPDSKYARDARLKLDLTLDHLAGKEMEIGRYYLKRDDYLAAVNRFRTVATKYQTTTQVPEALHRLTEAYLALGLEKEAQTAAAVLGYNFPGSSWYADSYALLASKNLKPEENKESWISRAWGTVF